MKKLFKVLLILVGSVALLLFAGFVFISARGVPSYEVQKLDFKATSTAESVARGKKLALLLCSGCHLNNQTGKLTGKQMLDGPPEFGPIYSQNITQDANFGIGSWTDGELVYLLRTGIKRDGQYSPPYMAKLPSMADEDINAIVSFLRSNDPLVAADATPDQPCEPSFLTKFLCNVAFKPLPMPSGPIAMPDTADAVQLGKYLAHNLDCFSCHSADFKTNDFLNPELSEGYFGGGNKPLNLEGKVMLTQNLTPDPETGIGSWSEEKFVRALRYGLKDGEPALMYPMLPYVHLTDQEAKAIYKYLMTVPPIKNSVPRSGI